MKNTLKITLLLVEDDSNVAQIEKLALEKLGYKIISTNTGENALKLVDDNPEIDLILMDIDLGADMEGTEVAKRILEKHDLPIIFLSAYNNPEFVSKTEGISSYGFVLKSSGLSILHASLKMAFNLFESRQKGKEKEKALLESEARYKALSNQLEAILDHIPGLVFYKDKNNNFIRVNKYVADASKKSKEELEGINLSDIYPQEVADLYYQDDLSVINSGLPKLNIEEQWETPDGIKWVSTSKIPFIDHSGEIIGVIGISQDITGRKQVEEAILASKQIIEGIINSIPVRVFWKDKNLFYLGCNKAFANDAGFADPEDIIGKDDFQMVWSHLAESYRKDDQQVINSTLPKLNIEEQLATPTGNTINVLTNKIPLLNSNGDVIGVLGTYMDVTERKRVENYREIGREVLQILNQPVNLQVSIRLVLESLKMHTGFDAVGIRLQNGDDFPYFAQEGFSNDFLLAENSLIEHSANGGVCRDQNGNVKLECTCGLVISGKNNTNKEFLTPGGSFWTNDSFPTLDLPSNLDPRLNPRNNCIHLGYASVALVPIREQDKIVGLIHLNDRRKNCFSLETIELLEDIASHIGEALIRKVIEQDIQLKNEELSKAVTEKDKFFSIIAHDLRSPFNGFLGLTTILAESLSGLTITEVQKMSENLRDSATGLFRLLENLLEWASMQRGLTTLTLTPLPLLPIFDESLAIIRQTANNKEIKFSYNIPANLIVLADRNLLHTVIRNIVSNAVKFTPKGGKVFILAKPTEINHIEISVKDSGIGMDRDLMDKLFQLGAVTNRLGTEGEASSGLGLILCKDFIYKLGGKIWVESEVGKGSTFYFTLPTGGGN